MISPLVVLATILFYLIMSLTLLTFGWKPKPNNVFKLFLWKVSRYINVLLGNHKDLLYPPNNMHPWVLWAWNKSLTRMGYLCPACGIDADSTLSGIDQTYDFREYNVQNHKAAQTHCTNKFYWHKNYKK